MKQNKMYYIALEIYTSILYILYIYIVDHN